jgi:hypothetical protein
MFSQNLVEVDRRHKQLYPEFQKVVEQKLFEQYATFSHPGLREFEKNPKTSTLILES